MQRIDALYIDGKFSFEEGMRSDPVRPSSASPLWRYISFEKYIHMLLTRGLFFSFPDKLDDPFEGSVAAPTIERLRSPQTAQNIETQTKKNHVVSCWHELKHESDAMWRLYTKKSCGIAIKTDFESLLRFISDMDGPRTSYKAGRVEYVDYKTEDIPVLEGMSLFYKRKSFSHECEVRVVCFFIKEILSKKLSKNLSDGGMLWEGKLDELIHEIVVSPFAEKWMYDFVRATTKRLHKSLAEKVRNSEIAKQTILQETLRT